MDLMEYVAMQLKNGKKPAEIRQLLVENGYPVYEVENALAVTEEKTKKERKNPFKVSINIKNAPGYVLIFALSIALITAGIITLALYLIKV